MPLSTDQLFEMSPLVSKVLKLISQLYPNSCGTYLEAGANDGLSHSNTYALEMRGWTGVLVEPSAQAFEQLVSNRPDNILIQKGLSSSYEKTITGTFSSGSLTGTAKQDLYLRDPKQHRIRGISRLSHWTGVRNHADLETVESTTLENILTEYFTESLDLLVLDVEGMELEVLQGLGSSRPRIIILETRKVDSLAIAGELLDLGYVCASNLSSFNKIDFPFWTEDHQDFGWCLKSDIKAIQVLSSV